MIDKMGNETVKKECETEREKKTLRELKLLLSAHKCDLKCTRINCQKQDRAIEFEGLGDKT